MKKILLIGALGFGVVGCSSIVVKPTSVSTLQQSPLCIEDNPKVTVPNFNDYLKDAFQRHQIKTQIYDKNDLPESCRYKLNYVAYRSWDISLYLSQIKLDLFEGNEKIAEVDWKQGSGAINKWRNSESKVFDAVDQLVGEAKKSKEPK